MKVRKSLVCAAAAAVAASALSVTASANLVVPADHADRLEPTEPMAKLKLYAPGEGVEADFDLMAVGSLKVVLTPDDQDLWGGQTGGALVFSCGPAASCPEDHNWIMANFWGVTDEDLELETTNPEEPLQLQKIGDYTYEATFVMDETNCFYQEAIDAEGYVQVACHEWGVDMADMEILSWTFYDKSGNLLASYDGKGNLKETGGAAPAAPAASTDDAAPAPAAGSVDGATAGGSKDSPDTGAADVAAVAGLAIVALGAAFVAKKRG